MTKTLKTLAVEGMTMGLALGAQAETVSGIKYIDAHAAFGEVQFKSGVKVKATLIP